MAASETSTEDQNHLSPSPKRQTAWFQSLPEEEKPEKLQLLNRPAKQMILNELSDEGLVRLLNAIDPDDATDILQLLPKSRQDKVLLEVSEELKAAASTLLQFDPDTAAGMMTLDYIQVDHEATIGEVAEKFKEHEKRTGRSPVILTFKNDKLAGFLPGHELGFSSQNEKITRHIRPIPVIHHAASHKEVIRTFRSHPHSRVAVLNNDGNVLGIIYSDDVLQFLHDQETSSLYHFAGVSGEETVFDPASRKIKLRYKWLIINLATAFLAAFTVGRFEDVISQYVLLAVYMPIVAGMGGNAATQTLAVMIRGIALKQIEIKTALHTLRNELGSGLVNGLINGVLVALVVIIFNNDFKIALILASAMIVNLLVASFFGTLVPLVMSKLGKDPASSATIFITTATDVLGFLAFLGLATVILR